MLHVTPPIAVIFFIVGIVFTSLHGGRGAPLPPPEELLTTSTVPLENLSLAPGDFIILADSTPVPIASAHVSMKYHVGQQRLLQKVVTILLQQQVLLMLQLNHLRILR